MSPSIKKHWRNARLFVLLLVPLTVVPILAGWVGDIAKDYFGGATLSKADPRLFGVGLPGILILAIHLIPMLCVGMPFSRAPAAPKATRRRSVKTGSHATTREPDGDCILLLGR